MIRVVWNPWLMSCLSPEQILSLTNGSLIKNDLYLILLKLPNHVMIIKVQGVLIGNSTLLNSACTQSLPHQKFEPSTTSSELSTLANFTSKLTWYIEIIKWIMCHWSHKKVLYYPNVMICIIWNLDFKCCIKKVFLKKMAYLDKTIAILYTQWKYINLYEITF